METKTKCHKHTATKNNSYNNNNNNRKNYQKDSKTNIHFSYLHHIDTHKFILVWNVAVVITSSDKCHL